jgi:hypothetical protein
MFPASGSTGNGRGNPALSHDGWDFDPIARYQTIALFELVEPARTNRCRDCSRRRAGGSRGSRLGHAADARCEIVAYLTGEKQQFSSMVSGLANSSKTPIK